MTQFNHSQVISNRIVNESYLIQGFRALGIELDDIQ
jgi:hypothetical protein